MQWLRDLLVLWREARESDVREAEIAQRRGMLLRALEKK
jgi:hypothetical protein